ncbi:hypothetical protein [Cohnella cholangitidis]|uniref:Uncharacterized protein n=1 Tax=Cohnella cholangitidis TaxID=2598458 RepID=A0A7G5BY14_9BACL|nr:hypothetical protein [Cohnella cholangitidis]QMV41848.1 hypothetical protein FPL14_12125 [Cohnella cholangitidis]
MAGSWVYVYGGETGYIKDTAGGFNIWMVKGQLIFVEGITMRTYTTAGQWLYPANTSLGTDYMYEVVRQGSGGTNEYVNIYRLNYFNCKKYGSSFCHLPGNGSVYSLRNSVNIYNSTQTSIIYTIPTTEKIVFDPGVSEPNVYGFTRGSNVFQTYDFRFIRVWGVKKADGTYTQFSQPAYVDFDIIKNPSNYDINTI